MISLVTILAYCNQNDTHHVTRTLFLQFICDGLIYENTIKSGFYEFRTSVVVGVVFVVIICLIQFPEHTSYS